MKKTTSRHPKGYNGTRTTIRRFSDVIPSVLSSIHIHHNERHDLILASWTHLVGPRIAPFTAAVSFSEGILKVNVHNSTLYSLLNRTERPKLLAALKEKFPKVEIKDIHFRMG